MCINTISTLNGVWNVMHIKGISDSTLCLVHCSIVWRLWRCGEREQQENDTFKWNKTKRNYFRLMRFYVHEMVYFSKLTKTHTHINNMQWLFNFSLHAINLLEFNVFNLNFCLSKTKCQWNRSSMRKTERDWSVLRAKK